MQGSTKQHYQAIIWLCSCVFLALGYYLGTRTQTVQADKFAQMFHLIQSNYVDTTPIEALEEKTIDYLLAQLDPHSTYIPPVLATQAARQIEGMYLGLGIDCRSFDDTLFVLRVIPQSPAQLAGILPGDRIIAANNIALTDTLTNTEIAEALKPNSKGYSQLTLYRNSTKQIINKELKAATISLNTSDIYYMVNATIGYVKIEKFAARTHIQMMQAVEALKKQGMKELIIDLRDNGGGLLNEAIQIANEFLPENAIITYTLGSHRKKEIYKADGKGTLQQTKLVILINHNTASASEILCAALQDNDRAVLIGNRSFGKGLVQEPFHLIDGSTLRLTIARYYTPSGRSIQKPYTNNIIAYQNEIYKRNNLKDTLNPVFDSTVIKKYFTKNGRLLTAGGGIRPDIFLVDTIADSTEIEQLMPGLFYSQVFEIYLLDKMQPILKMAKNKYPSLAPFEQQFNISEAQVKDFIPFAHRIYYLKKLCYSKKVSDIVRKHLKANIALQLFGESNKSKFINNSEGVFSKCLYALKKFDTILNIKPKIKSSFDY